MNLDRGVSGPSLLQQLAHNAEKKPHSEAIVFLPEGDPGQSASLTYLQLKNNACRIAAALSQRAAAGDRAVLLLPSGPNFFAVVWGCWLAGLVVVPVAVPRMDAQLAFTKKIIADSGATLLITSSQLLPALQEGLGADLSWLAMEDALKAELQPDWVLPDSQSVALLQYTSGSTGMPKGVMVTHANLAASIDLMLLVADVDGDSTAVSWLPLFHNMGLISFGLLPLCAGARLVLIPTEYFMTNPACWFKVMSHFKATHSGAPNIGYESCLNFLPDALLQQLDLSAWRLAAIGSEPLKATLLDNFAARFARCGFRPETFVTTYGFSEATVFSAGAETRSIVTRFEVDKAAFEKNQIQPVQSQAKTLVSVGRAREHVAIVDPDTQRRCNERELGEIWISGGTVAKGYWNNPEISAETFGIYASDGSGPYVRSGDIGLIADGNLYVVGRRKELIIVDSKKLHPLDIEQSIHFVSPAFVPYATAAATWQSEQGEALAIFQELKPDADPAEFETYVTAIRDAVYERFGVNVARVVFLRMGSLPRTHNGKLQRIRCCELADSGALGSNLLLDWCGISSQSKLASAQSEAEPLLPVLLTPTQQKLVTLWSEVLNQPIRSIDVDFVSLGGQSIVATQLVTKLRELFAIELSIRALFNCGSIRRLAQHIDQLLSSGATFKPEEGSPQQRNAQDWLPLSSAQKRLWLLSQIDSQTAAYHMCASFSLVGDLNRSALEQAFALLVDRHAILRTVYRYSETGSAQQKPLSNFTFGLEFHDLSGSENLAQRSALADALLEGSRTRLFDLTGELMMRACLIRIDVQQHALALTLHHIAADGWSVGILVNELREIYSALVQDRQPILPALAWQYADWSLQHERPLEHPAQQAKLHYWQHQLAELPELHSLPLRSSRPAEPGFRGESFYSTVSRATLETLEQSARTQGLTLYMQLQTALAILIARLSGSQDVAIGAAYANRTQADCSDIVGFFVNSLVIRHRLPADAPVAALLQQCRETLLDAYEQDLPFEQLVEVLKPHRHAHANPLFQVMLNLQSKQTWQLQLPGLSIEPVQVSAQEA